MQKALKVFETHHVVQNWRDEVLITMVTCPQSSDYVYISHSVQFIISKCLIPHPFVGNFSLAWILHANDKYMSREKYVGEQCTREEVDLH